MFFPELIAIIFRQFLFVKKTNKREDKFALSKFHSPKPVHHKPILLTLQWQLYLAFLFDFVLYLIVF